MGSVKAAVIGATGVVGQQFAVALQGHPWFALEGLVASSRSAGKPYHEALRDPVTGASRWALAEPIPAAFGDLPVVTTDEFRPEDYDLIFSAVESDEAQVLEPRYAAARPVVTTASTFRMADDVPLIIPGVNNDHTALVARQAARGWRGFIVAQPNCTTIGLAITLKPLQDAFGVRMALMTSMQSLSGAGRSPGVVGLDILDNIVPYIRNEEEKVQRETQKILGALHGDAIAVADIPVSCTCTRVNVLDGHTESVFVALGHYAEVSDVIAVLRGYNDGLRELGLPLAPPEYIVVHDDPFRPQPRLDRDTHNGMATVVGRVRADPALPNGVKYVLVSHNTKMGAARGAVLTAELLTAQGRIG